MFRAGAICAKNLEAEAAPWRSRKKILESGQTRTKWTFRVEVYGTDQPSEDIICYLCDRCNFGGYASVVQKNNEKTTYEVVTWKD